jgi:hypothetical protein
VIDVVLDLDTRCLREAEPEALRPVEPRNPVGPIHFEIVRERLESLRQIAHPQDDALEHARLALPLGSEERQLPAPGVRAHQGEVAGPLDHVHAEVLADEFRERIPVGDPEGDVIEGVGLHRGRATVA